MKQHKFTFSKECKDEKSRCSKFTVDKEATEEQLGLIFKNNHEPASSQAFAPVSDREPSRAKNSFFSSASLLLLSNIKLNNSPTGNRKVSIASRLYTKKIKIKNQSPFSYLADVQLATIFKLQTIYSTLTGFKNDTAATIFTNFI